MTFKVIKVTNTVAIRYATYDFLLVLHLKYVCILYLFRYINTYLPKILRQSRDLNDAHLGDSLSCES